MVISYIAFRESNLSEFDQRTLPTHCWAVMTTAGFAWYRMKYARVQVPTSRSEVVSTISMNAPAADLTAPRLLRIVHFAAVIVLVHD